MEAGSKSTLVTRGSKWPTFAPYLLSLLRIAAAFLFVQSGTVKLFGFPTAPPGGTPAAFSLHWFAGVLETFGGALLLVGLFTRPVAFLLSGQMAVAYFQAHAPHGFWPAENGGGFAALFCFVWLYISAAGPGPWSLDAKLGRRRGRAA
jgi:putative oxidoreductase